jgi:uncharacterized membrane protein
MLLFVSATIVYQNVKKTKINLVFIAYIFSKLEAKFYQNVGLSILDVLVLGHDFTDLIQRMRRSLSF